MSRVVDDALALAASGLPVFPCRDDKSPCLGGGYRDATRDPAVIKRMFSRYSARLIGVPTGEVSGVDVLDVDPRNGGHQWEAANLSILPETAVHETRSKGRHLLFRHHPGVRNSEGRIGPGIDVRGTGGHAIWPPSPGWRVISDAPIAPWPAELLVPGLALPPVQEAQSIGSLSAASIGENRVGAYTRALLAKVSRAPEGAKHVTLRNAALCLGGVLDQVGASDADAIGWLMAALPETVADWKLAERTAAWGIAQGRLKPILLEDRS